LQLSAPPTFLTHDPTAPHNCAPENGTSLIFLIIFAVTVTCLA